MQARWRWDRGLRRREGRAGRRVRPRWTGQLFRSWIRHGRWIGPVFSSPRPVEDEDHWSGSRNRSRIGCDCGGHLIGREADCCRWSGCFRNMHACLGSQAGRRLISATGRQEQDNRPQDEQDFRVGFHERSLLDESSFYVAGESRGCFRAAYLAAPQLFITTASTCRAVRLRTLKAYCKFSGWLKSAGLVNSP